MVDRAGLWQLRWQGNIWKITKNITVYSEIFPPVLCSPLSPRCRRANLRLAKSNISNYLSLNTTPSGRIKDQAKLFASLEGKKLHSGKNNPVYSYRIAKGKSDKVAKMGVNAIAIAESQILFHWVKCTSSFHSILCDYKLLHYK